MTSDLTRGLRAALRFLFSFRGRLGRLEFLLCLAVLVPAAQVFHKTLPLLHSGLLTGPLRWASAVYTVAVAWAFLAAAAKRLHDLGFSGAWVAPVLFGAAVLPPVRWAAVVVFVLVPGEGGDNRFGPPPRFMREIKLWRLGRAFAGGRIDAAAFNAARAEILGGRREEG